jgi:hypothetical protein
MDLIKYARPNLSQHKVNPPGLGHIVQGRTVSVQCLVVAQDRDTSVRDDFSQGLKIHGIDDPSKNIQGYLVQGQFVKASYLHHL